MLKRGILVIFRANIISLFFSLATNFLLPKYLSIEAYAAIKSFQLYITYVGLLHFGFADGMYLKYGGKNKGSINTSDIKSDILSMRTFQASMTIACLVISILLKDPVWVAFSMAVLPLNMASYYKLLYQATGEFKKYGQIMNITTIVTFIANMGLLFVLSIEENGLPYIAAYVLIDILIWIYLEIRFEKEFKLKKVEGHFSAKIVFTDIKDGILLMLGNLSSAFFTGMDCWFVKALMDTIAFAQYSFAVSIENFLNIAVTPVSVTLYNYFCNHIDRDSVKRVQGYIILFAAVLPACAFPAKFILETFLTKYIDATSVLFYLFAAQSYAIINKCIYINLYKATRNQKKYFVKLIMVLVIGFALNGICWLLIKDKSAFAIGTLLSNMIWFFISALDFKEVQPLLREYAFVVFETGALITCGLMFNSIMGLIMYVVATLIMAALLMKQQMTSILNEGKKLLKRNGGGIQK